MWMFHILSETTVSVVVFCIPWKKQIPPKTIHIMDVSRSRRVPLIHRKLKASTPPPPQAKMPQIPHEQQGLCSLFLLKCITGLLGPNKSNTRKGHRFLFEVKESRSVSVISPCHDNQPRNAGQKDSTTFTLHKRVEKETPPHTPPYGKSLTQHPESRDQSKVLRAHLLLGLQNK